MTKTAIRPWLGPAAAMIVMGLVYRETLVTLVGEWFTYDVAYGLVILVICLHMVWRRRERLGDHRLINPALLPGGLLTAAGALILVAGKVSGTDLLAEFSLMVTLSGLIWLVLGWNHLRALLLPIFYLIFMMALPGEILGGFSIHLQRGAAVVATKLLTWLGMPVLMSGETLFLPHITLEVARECSGINHIVALMALAVPMAAYARKSAWNRWFFVVLAFFLGIFLNGARIAMIGFWSVKHKELHGPMSLLFTSFIFFFGVILMSLLLLLPWGRGPAVARHEPERPAVVPGVGGRRSVWAAALAIIVFAAAWLLLAYYRPVPVHLRVNLGDFPRAVGTWRGEEDGHLGEEFKSSSQDELLQRIYRDDAGHAMGVYVAYFTYQAQGREIFSYYYDRLHDRAAPADVSLDGGPPFLLKRTVHAVAGEARTTYFWYVVAGRNLAGRYAAKLATAAGGILRRRNNGAIIVVTALPGRAGRPEAPEDVQRDFLRAVIPVMAKALRGAD